MKNRARRHRYLVPAMGTLPAPQLCQFVSAMVPTSRAHEAFWPAAGGEVRLTSLFGRKLRLKFAHVLGKRRARHNPTLQFVVC